MNRREYLKLMAASTLFSGTSGAMGRCAGEPYREAVSENNIPLTGQDEILERVKKHRPSLGGVIPADLKHRLGATHAAGKYHLTDEPFLIEGAKKLLEFGSNVGKFFMDFTMNGLYPFCSDWSALPKNCRLVDLAKHPYFEEVFNLPFSTFVLEITHFNNIRPFSAADNDFHEYEEQFEELTEYLYRRFSDRPVTFIFQNWEGDWLFNGSYAAVWDQQMLDDLPRRIDCFTRWFSARQRGVEKARNHFTSDNSPACRVLHAAEVNRVLTLLQGTPTLTEKVLPNIAPDLVSWSSYDGMNSAVDTWHGIELIRHFMKHSGFLPEPTVMIGEIGFPERGRTQEEIVDFWDRSLAVFFAHDIPLILHWELYCNEITEEAKNKPVPENGVYTAEDLRGFWLYLPDGSLSHAGRYLMELIKGTETVTR